jgi:hypothetical protein
MCGFDLTLLDISGQQQLTAKVEPAIQASVNHPLDMNKVHLFDKETGNVIE